MNRLKELRKEKKLTQKELADEIGVHYRTLQNWETDKAEIKSDKAQALADYFGVHIGYLLGHSDKPYTENPVEHIKEAYVRLLTDIRTVDDVSLADLKEFGFKLHDLAVGELARRYYVDVLFNHPQLIERVKSNEI